MSPTEEYLDPRRRAAVARRLRGRLTHLRPRGDRSPHRRGLHLLLPPLRRGRGGGAGSRGHRCRLAGGARRTGHLGSELPSLGGRGAAGGSRGDNELHERRLLLEPMDVALRRREPMCRVRGVVHGPAEGLIAPQKGGRPAREATLDRAATLRPSFLPSSPECVEGVFSDVQLRDAERFSVKSVMSSSCSQPSPVKRSSSSIRKSTSALSSTPSSETSALSLGKLNIWPSGSWASTRPSL